MGKNDSKGKKGTEKAAKKPRNLHERYTISGESIERKNKTCPKCGPGSFLAAHKDRVVCGKCAYVEYNSAKSESEEAQASA